MPALVDFSWVAEGSARKNFDGFFSGADIRLGARIEPMNVDAQQLTQAVAPVATDFDVAVQRLAGFWVRPVVVPKSGMLATQTLPASTTVSHIAREHDNNRER